MSDDRKPAKRIDVTPADDAPTDEAAKPVIVKRAMLKSSGATAPDGPPPVTDETPVSAPALPKRSASKSVVKPLSQPADTSDTPAADADRPAVDASDASPADDATKPEEKPEAPAKSETAAPADSAPADAAPDKTDEPAKDEAAKSDADAAKEAAGPTEEELNAEAEAQAKHDEAIQKLIDAKQYFLPINAVEKRKTKQFLVLGVVLSVLLLLAWADVALDAGLVQIPGVQPVTHFFSN